MRRSDGKKQPTIEALVEDSKLFSPTGNADSGQDSRALHVGKSNTAMPLLPMPFEVAAYDSEELSPRTDIGDELTDEQILKFGDRHPAGYKKLSLLGSGSVAVVWLA